MPRRFASFCCIALWCMLVLSARALATNCISEPGVNPTRSHAVDSSGTNSIDPMTGVLRLNHTDSRQRRVGKRYDADHCRHAEHYAGKPATNRYVVASTAMGSGGGGSHGYVRKLQIAGRSANAGSFDQPIRVNSHDTQ